MHNDQSPAPAAETKTNEPPAVEVSIFAGTRAEALAKRAALPDSWGKRNQPDNEETRLPRVVFGAQLLEARPWKGEPGVFAGVVIDMRDSSALQALRAAMPGWSMDICARTIFEKHAWVQDLSIAAALCWADAAGVLREKSVVDLAGEASLDTVKNEKTQKKGGESEDDFLDEDEEDEDREDEDGLWKCGSTVIKSRFYVAQQTGLVRITNYSDESQTNDDGVVHKTTIGRDSGNRSLVVSFPDETSFFWPAGGNETEYMPLTRDIALKMAPGVAQAFAAMGMEITGASAVALSGVRETLDSFVAMMNAQTERSELTEEVRIGEEGAEGTPNERNRRPKAL